MSICGYPHGEPNETLLYETRCGGCSHVRSANYVRADVVEREREADRAAIRGLKLAPIVLLREQLRTQPVAYVVVECSYCLHRWLEGNDSHAETCPVVVHALAIQRAQDAKG